MRENFEFKKEKKRNYSVLWYIIVFAKFNEKLNFNKIFHFLSSITCRFYDTTSNCSKWKSKKYSFCVPNVKIQFYMPDFYGFLANGWHATLPTTITHSSVVGEGIKF